MGHREDLRNVERLLRNARQASPPTPSRERVEYGTNEVVAQRYRDPSYKLPSGQKRALFLGYFDALYDAGLITNRSQPAACAGPNRKGWTGASKFMCRQSLLCGPCWDRRRHEQAIGVLQRQLHGGPVVSFSMTTPAIRHDAEAMREARDDFTRVVQGLGWTCYSIYVHTYGENPGQGPKGHLDGIIGALPGSDSRSVLGEHIKGDWNKKRARFEPCSDVVDALRHCWDTRVARHEPQIHARVLAPHKPGYVWGLLKAAKYASRQTFPTLRLIAGQMDAAGTHFRLTNVNGTLCKEDHVGDIKAIPNTRRSDGLFPGPDVLSWAQLAAHWDRAVGRHKHSTTRPIHPRYMLDLEDKRMKRILTAWRIRAPSWA